jgi:hypothetical protein
MNYAQDGIELLAAEAKPDADYVRQRRFGDLPTVEFTIYEKVKCAIVSLDHLNRSGLI